MSNLEAARKIALEGFAEADAMKARAAELPRWRWLKRHNLNHRAQITERAMGRFFGDHQLLDKGERSGAAPIIIVQRKRSLFF